MRRDVGTSQNLPMGLELVASDGLGGVFSSLKGFFIFLLFIFRSS